MIGDTPTTDLCAPTQDGGPVDLKLDEVPFCYGAMGKVEAVVGVGIRTIKDETVKLLGTVGCDANCSDCKIFEVVKFGKRSSDAAADNLARAVSWMIEITSRVIGIEESRS